MVEKILLKLRNGITNDQQWFFNHLNWGLKRAKNDQNDVSLKNDREDTIVTIVHWQKANHFVQSVINQRLGKMQVFSVFVKT